MSLDKIILELKKIKKDILNNDVSKVNNNLDNLIEKLQKEFKKSNFSNNPSDKKRLKAIERVLNVKETTYPQLSCYTPFGNDRVAFTDGYQAYILNDKFLPYNIAFNEDINQDFINNYITEYTEKLEQSPEVYDGSYPNLDCFFNRIAQSINFELDINEFMSAYKTTEKVKKQKIMQFNYDTKNVICIDGEYIKNAIDILKLKDKIVLEIENPTSPVYIHNEYNEVALILPIRQF